MDWVNHLIGSLAQSHKVCGNGETGEFHSDGESSMQVEFVANRNIEATGFHYTVYCTAPGFDLNAVIQGVVPATPVERRAAVQCTSPPSPDSGCEKRQSYYSPLVYPTVCTYHVIAKELHYSVAAKCCAYYTAHHCSGDESLPFI